MEVNRRLIASITGAVLTALAFVQAVGALTTPTYVATLGGAGHAETYPGGMDVDPSGTVYVADTGNDQVKAYLQSGRVRWVQGRRGPKVLGSFDNPRDIAYVGGRVYVADLGYSRVQVLDAATGAPLEAWSTGIPAPIGISAGVDQSGRRVILVALETRNQISEYTTAGVLIRTIGAGQLSAPRDAATDPAGNIYVADYGNNRISKFSAGGAWIKNWGGPGGKDGQFRRPYGVAVDAQSRIYVADSTNHRVQIFDAEGTFLATYGTAGTGPGQFSMLRRVAVGRALTNPDFYLADLWGYKIERVSQDSQFRFSYDQTFAGAAPPFGLFNEPSGVFVDASHTYVADSVNQRMQRFDTQSGIFQLEWGERGWGDNLLGFNWPRDLTVSAVTGTVWVADTKNGRLVEFDPDGNATGRTFGALGPIIGDFNRISGVVSYATSLIVADSANDRVQRWDMSTPTPTLIWNTPAANPQALALDGATVLVTDTRNNRLLRLDAGTGVQIGGYLGLGNLHAPDGVAVDSIGRIWVADPVLNGLVELTQAGTLLQTYGTFGNAHGQFNQPTHLAIYDNKLYICDTWNDRVEIFALGP